MIRFMQSAVGRLLRVAIGVVLVVLAAYTSVLVSTILLILGTTIAVLGLAGVCLVHGARESHA